MDVYFKVSRTTIVLEDEGKKEEECDENNREGEDHM